MAAAPGFSTANWAAVDVLVTSMVRADGQVLGQPIAALRQGLRLAVDLAHVGPRALAQQRMVDSQLHFAANPHPHPREHVERVGHAAVGRVLDRHQPEIRLLPVDFLEHGGDAADRHELDALAEAMDRRQVAETVERPEKGDARLADQTTGSRWRPRAAPPARRLAAAARRLPTPAARAIRRRASARRGPRPATDSAGPPRAPAGPAPARVGPAFDRAGDLGERAASGRRAADLRFVPADSAAFVFDLPMIAPIPLFYPGGRFRVNPSAAERSAMLQHTTRLQRRYRRYAEA